MKASLLPLLTTLLLVVFTSSQGRAENTNDSAWTGETNGVSAITPVDSTNSASSSALIRKAALPETTSRVATLAVSDLREYEAQSPAVRSLLSHALALTTLDLSYKYGSSDPKNGGMDCSGTIYYLLSETGLNDVPRDASGIYQWVWTRSLFRAVTSSNPDTFELALLKPGDLLFWTGTYRVDHDPPITHVMIYLGINRHSGRRVMVGASEGRRFNGISRYGVSVFDFTLPGKSRASEPVPETSSATDLQARFVGYGPIPGLEEIKNGATAKDGL